MSANRPTTNSSLLDQHPSSRPQYGSFQGGAGAPARQPSLASRVTFSAPPSPTRHHEAHHNHRQQQDCNDDDDDDDFVAPEEESDFFMARYPTLSDFKQRLALGIVASFLLLLATIFLFSLFVDHALTLLLTPVFLGAAAYLSSDALRAHFVYQLVDSDTRILILHAVLQECLRLPAVLLAVDLVAPADADGLAQVAAVATGVAWGMAATESTLRLWTLWQQTQLYVDVLPVTKSTPTTFSSSERPAAAAPSPHSSKNGSIRSLEDGDVTAFLRSDHPHHHHHHHGPSPTEDDDEGQQPEQQDMTDAFLDASVRERERLDLEDQLGMPLFALPSFLLPLWSFNSSVGLDFLWSKERNKGSSTHA